MLLRPFGVAFSPFPQFSFNSVDLCSTLLSRSHIVRRTALTVRRPFEGRKGNGQRTPVDDSRPVKRSANDPVIAAAPAKQQGNKLTTKVGSRPRNLFLRRSERGASRTLGRRATLIDSWNLSFPFAGEVLVFISIFYLKWRRKGKANHFRYGYLSRGSLRGCVGFLSSDFIITDSITPNGNTPHVWLQGRSG